MFVVYFEASQTQYFMASCCIAVTSTRTIFGKKNTPAECTHEVSEKVNAAAPNQ
jgi:hypothetical protein